MPKRTLFGTGIGLGFGFFSLATGGCTEDAWTFAAECLLTWSGLGAGAGALTGLILRSDRNIYRADRGTQFSWAPRFSKNGAGVFGSIVW